VELGIVQLLLQAVKKARVLAVVLFVMDHGEYVMSEWSTLLVPPSRKVWQRANDRGNDRSGSHKYGCL
jgi:hypothetical protein